MARILALILAAAASAHAFARDLDKLYEKAKFQIGTRKFEAYIADDDSKREQGLMYIEKLPADTGMLFVFEEERQLGFWMKNTLIPLQIAFLDSKGKIVDIQEMQVASSMMSNVIPTYQSKAPAVFALEMNTGWFTRNKIKPGQRLTLASTPKSVLLKKFMAPSTKQTGQ